MSARGTPRPSRVETRARILACIRDCTAQQGYPPTALQVGQTLGLCKATIAKVVHQLVAEGLLPAGQQGKHRTMLALIEPDSVDDLRVRIDRLEARIARLERRETAWALLAERLGVQLRQTRRTQRGVRS